MSKSMLMIGITMHESFGQNVHTSANGKIARNIFIISENWNSNLERKKI